MSLTSGKRRICSRAIFHSRPEKRKTNSIRQNISPGEIKRLLRSKKHWYRVCFHTLLFVFLPVKWKIEAVCELFFTRILLLVWLAQFFCSVDALHAYNMDRVEILQLLDLEWPSLTPWSNLSIEAHACLDKWDSNRYRQNITFLYILNELNTTRPTKL